MFDRPKAGSHRPIVAAWVDGTRIRRVGVSQRRLRRILQAISGEPRRKQGGSDEEGDGSVEDVGIRCVEEPWVPLRAAALRCRATDLSLSIYEKATLGAKM
jgi:hypothetical protein